MATARQRDEWDRLSALLAMTFNVHADGKKVKATRPADFNPFIKRQKPKPLPVSFNVLRAVLFPGSVKADELVIDPEGKVSVMSQGRTVAGPNRSMGPLP
jgi:hypothetical protein